MRKDRTFVALVTFVAACAPARIPHAETAESASAAAYLAAPSLSNLVASRRGDHIAWLALGRGEHQVWSAAGPDFAPKVVARWPGDDGRPLSQLSLEDDGARVVFVRGVEEGEVVNPTSDPHGGRAEIWVADAMGATPPVLVAEGTSPVLRPDGSGVDFIVHGQLHHAPVDRPGDDALLVAHGKQGSLTWSPDGTRFAFVSDRDDHSLVGVYDPRAARIQWLSPSVDRDALPVWSPDGKQVAFFRFRGKKADEPLDVELFGPRTPVSIVVADATTGEGRVVVPEDDTGGFAQLYLDAPLLWGKNDDLIFPSERDGWVRLWRARVTSTGAPTPLTMAGCETEAAAMSPDRTKVVATSNCSDEERRHLMLLSANGSTSRSVTDGMGVEWGGVITESGAVAYIASKARGVPQVTVYVPNHAQRELGPDAAALHMPPFVEPETVTLRAPDGLELHGQLFLPPSASRPAKMPAIVFVHGGPIRQMLAGWHPMSFYHQAYEMNQLLAARGYAVLALNYRLGVGYGRAFRRAASSGPQGASEYQDVLAAGRWLAARTDVDPARVGIWGGSYGGLLTGLALSRDSSTFHAGVDLCGVSDWSRFVHDDLHGEAAERLAHASSPVANVDGWTSPVLLVHGDDDHSVPFSQTVDLVQRLRDSGKAHVEILVYPDEQHGYELSSRWVEVAGRMVDFFDRSLSAPRSTP